MALAGQPPGENLASWAGSHPALIGSLSTVLHDRGPMAGPAPSRGHFIDFFTPRRKTPADADANK